MTVQAATSRPAAARALERGGGDGLPLDRDRATAEARRQRRRRPRPSATALSQRGQSGSALAIAASDASSNEETTARSGALPRPARSASAVALRVARALELDVEEGLGRQRREHLGQRRDPRLAQLGRRQVGDGLVAALDALERLVVEEHRDAVPAEADVELHAVDARRPGREHQRLERVLRRQAPVAAVGEPERPRGRARRRRLRGGLGAHPIRTVAAIPRWSDPYRVGSPTAGRSNTSRASSTATAPRSQT